MECDVVIVGAGTAGSESAAHHHRRTRRPGPGRGLWRRPMTTEVVDDGTPVSFAGPDLITFRTGLVHTEETYLDTAEIMARPGAL